MQSQNTIGKEELERGYSREEEYFFRQNQDLIERKRREFEQRRAGSPRPEHWMKCPKCGAQMKEVELAGIRIDQCDGCRGIYFDQGELEILIESKEHRGFFGAVKRLFT